ncbi:sarcoglycan complex subunit protein domain-containing protein [Phthorimaea operculella]|nr:sarcoglycan complex subunit protein domain-containing protein [Phthorimaea operculella]
MSVAGAEATPGAIHGWGCTPTGDPPSAAVSSTEQEQTPPKCLPATLRRGWRRTALYCIIVLLMILVFLNLALTLWIISALKLSPSGIGPIKIVRGGVQLSGHAWIVDKLVSSTIASQPSHPITVHSHRNFTVLVSEPHQPDHAKLLIKRDLVECSGRAFHVEDSRGNSVFHASRDEVRVAADTFAIDSDGGLTVKSAVQTPAVRAPPGSDLQLESATRRLELRAPQSIHLESRAGGIDIISHSNIKMDSVVGAIKIDAPNIIIANLKEANLTDQPDSKIKSKKVKVYQLCACSSGKLFLAAPDTPCEAREDDIDLCR